MTLLGRLRTPEWLYLAYFLYVALLASILPLTPAIVLRAWLMLAGAAVLFAILTTPLLSIARDWIEVALVLVAYRQMDWFSVESKARILERTWVGWDRRFLFERGFGAWVEIMGPAGPWILEFSYLLVYGIGAFSVAAIYIAGDRDRASRFLAVYLTGTLLAYALFPYFPSDPPRVVFPDANLPRYMTATRSLNLFLVGGYGIHSSVFPSAHVSSAFSAAWGLLRFLPEYRWVARAMLIYAGIVSVATVYGRYHYAADAVAGLVVSLIALASAFHQRPKRA